MLKYWKIDLHGFSVKEALRCLKMAFRVCTAPCRLTIITGKGLRSQGGIPRIKDAVAFLLVGMKVSKLILKTRAVSLSHANSVSADGSSWHPELPLDCA